MGGYNDVNEERLLLLKPDLVLLLKTHQPLIAFCQQHRLKVATFDAESIEGIRDMVKRVGKITGKEHQASIWLKAHPFPLRPVKVPAQSVLVVLEQVVRNGRIEAAYVLGRESFYEPMLKAAGLVSVFNGSQRYPMIGREGLGEFAPDKVIILEAGQSQWYKGVWPTSTKMVFLPKTFMKRPGPRYDQILDAFRHIAVE